MHVGQWTIAHSLNGKSSKACSLGDDISCIVKLINMVDAIVICSRSEPDYQTACVPRLLS
jgi:hypothetical protein